MKEIIIVDINNFATCENLTTSGYQLISRDENGNIIKTQNCLWRHKSNKKMIDNFFPTEDYKIPNTSNFLNKLPQGETTIRVMSPAIIGYAYFTKDNKPVRSREAFEERPSDIKDDGKINHFWAFVVYHYEDEKFKVFEVSQKTIQTPLKALIDNSKWGNPKGYDITITRKGTTMNDTEYSVMPNPHSEVSDEIKSGYAKLNINLENMFENKDPFQK